MTRSSEILPSSFRDPHGFVFRSKGLLLRQVNEVHRIHFDAMIESGLYESLTSEGVLIPHDEVSLELAVTPSAYRVIRPEEIPFVSYPYEWSFSALRDAALLTLRAQELAMAHGMSLRDASAYNVQFLRGKPILIDTLSFELARSGEPWTPYRQFCEHFLAPLAMMSMRDVRMGRVSSTYLDGVPLDLAAMLLPAKARLDTGLQLHLRMHARSQVRHADSEVARGRARLSSRALAGLLSSLRKSVEKLESPAGTSAWSDYRDEADHYPPVAAERKESLVHSWIDQIPSTTIWDLGANTGWFATIAATKGKQTVALDSDALAIDIAYREMRRNNVEHLLPLVMDITNPSPALGWAHRERLSLLERGPADLVLALAVIHHLAIGKNVPLAQIAHLLAQIGSWVILEWVPKEDRKISWMLRAREDVFEDYREDVLVAQLRESFIIEAREQLPDIGRVMYLLSRR